MADLCDDDPPQALQVLHVRGVHIGGGRQALLLLQGYIVVVIRNDVHESVAVLVLLQLADVACFGGPEPHGVLLHHLKLLGDHPLGQLGLVHHPEHVDPHGLRPVGHGGLPEEVHGLGQGDGAPAEADEDDAEEGEDDGEGDQDDEGGGPARDGVGRLVGNRGGRLTGGCCRKSCS